MTILETSEPMRFYILAWILLAAILDDSFINLQTVDLAIDEIKSLHFMSMKKANPRKRNELLCWRLTSAMMMKGKNLCHIRLKVCSFVFDALKLTKPVLLQVTID